MPRLVEGQATASGREGQVTSGGTEGQAFVAQDDPDSRRVESQFTEDDTAEGQENDARPFGERRPYPNTQGVQPDARAKQGPLPPTTRRVAGSVKR
jgi:hypothetical protein